MIMHAKFQCSIINTSEDMGQVKVFVTDGRKDEWDFGKAGDNNSYKLLHRF